MTRTSPLHDQIAALNPQWTVMCGMQVAAGVGAGEAAARESVAIADLSCLDKAGFKGPGAAGWLHTQGIAAPAQANAWVELPAGGVIARLGRTEFFLEDGTAGDTASRLLTSLGTGIAGVYPVIRQDAGIALVGRRVNELLVESCNVNFQELDPASRTVVMTMMVGVAVLVIRQDYESFPGFRVWCDPTSAPYLWETLAGIAMELGGGPIESGGLLRTLGRLE